MVAELLARQLTYSINRARELASQPPGLMSGLARHAIRVRIRDLRTLGREDLVEEILSREIPR